MTGGTTVKPFLDYKRQVDLLESRGMIIEDRARAEQRLMTVNYYRLSGYWHTMRALSNDGSSLDVFRSGASFDLVMELYDFDERLRAAIFIDISRVELAMRALIGHYLGAVDPLIYLDSSRLGVPARRPARKGDATKTIHEVWLTRFRAALRASREDFVSHHDRRYNGDLPIWVAVEVMDWGMLSHLYHMAPKRVREKIARVCHLNAPQMESWLKCLNILRNYAAHHARVFNRGFDIKPKLSRDPRLDFIRDVKNRVFGQATLIRYLHCNLGLSGASQLLSVFDTFPHNDLVPFKRLGAPTGWCENPLWGGAISKD